MANVISMPFRLTPSGDATTVIQNSEKYYSEQIAAILMTEPGERILVPGLGVANMPFNGYSKSAVSQQAATYLPGIEVTSLSVKNVSDEMQDVSVTFEIVGEQ